MIHCFYHSADLDGHCSGAIVKYKFLDAVMHPIDYGDEFPWDEIGEYDKVFMVDFALQPWDQMQRLIDTSPIVWIDHHTSAINDYESKHKTLTTGGKRYEVPGIRDTTRAACELTWEYLFPNRPVPLAVKLLSLYDSGTYQGHELEDMVLPFQMSMRMEDLNPKNWEGLVEKGGTGPKWHNLFLQTDLGFWISEGRLLLRYDESQKAKYVKTYAFETILAVPFGWEAQPYMGRGQKHVYFNAIAVNIGHTNSKVFDSVWRKECPECSGNGIIYDCLDHTGCVSNHSLPCPTCHNSGYLEPYDLMITFVRRSDKLWNVSLYSTKEAINCGAIAKNFGGGGHKSAAGFQCKTLPFDI